ncbi:prepilin-type N-terminal cleavage/methylation domain-containing protein, partial [Castellaniella sp.]
MRGDPQRGFTLLETMVVLLIVGVAMGAAGVSAFGDAQMRTLRQDAQRLAGLFMTAQTEARAVGVRIAWRPGERGFAFE